MTDEQWEIFRKYMSVWTISLGAMNAALFIIMLKVN